MSRETDELDEVTKEMLELHPELTPEQVKAIYLEYRKRRS